MIVGLIRLEVWAFLGGAAVIVLYKLLTGRINLAGLLGTGDNAITAHRVQMLLITFYVALDYVRRVAAAPHLATLPDVPQNMLLLLGGSHTLYLGGKGVQQLGWLSFLQPPQQD